MTRSRLALAALLLMAAIWGSTFFLIKDLVSRVPVTDMLAARFAIATVPLAILAARRWNLTRDVALRSAAAGLVYGAAQIAQTYGLAYTAASISGFVTGLYVVLTPVLSALVLKVRISGITWLAVGLATVGLGVFSLDGMAISFGAAITFVSAILYAVHIIALGRWSAPGQAMGMTVVQMLVISVLCTIAALPGGIQLPSSGTDWAILLYLALIAGALTMWLQTWAQAHVDPTRAAVVMSMEPVFGAGFAVALGGESVNPRMIIGGLAIVSAMYLVEVGPALRRRRVLIRARATEAALPTTAGQGSDDLDAA